MNTHPPGISSPASSLACGFMLIVSLTGCGTNGDGKLIARQERTPADTAPPGAIPLVGSPGTAAPSVTPSPTPADSCAAVANPTIPNLVDATHAVPIPNPPLGTSPRVDRVITGIAPGGGPPAAASRTDASPPADSRPW